MVIKIQICLESLVSGDVEGKLSDLYSKIDLIQSKAGKFDVCRFFSFSVSLKEPYVSYLLLTDAFLCWGIFQRSQQRAE